MILLPVKISVLDFMLTIQILNFIMNRMFGMGAPIAPCSDANSGNLGGSLFNDANLLAKDDPPPKKKQAFSHGDTAFGIWLSD